MKRTTYPNLGDLRERLLGVPRATVARWTSITEARLEAVETGAAEPSFFEIEALATAYGVEPECLDEEPIEIAAGDAFEMLALSDEFREISHSTKARVIQAANAARDLVWLRGVDQWATFRREAKVLAAPRRSGRLPYQEGRHYAEQLRRTLTVQGPIASVRDFVTDRYPSVAVLYAHLGRDDDVAGLAFADRSHGPTIVLNLDGRNENPAVRRFSLAHELCHLLVDWNRQEPLATLSMARDDARLDVEQRANGFAVRLLCPERVVAALGKETAEVAAHRLMSRWGLHYRAARLYLEKVGGHSLPVTPSESLLGLGAGTDWAAAEAPLGLDGFPLDDVPPERRTLVARHAALAYSSDRISRDHFARLLGLTPAAPVERVLDFFALDPPSDAP